MPLAVPPSPQRPPATRWPLLAAVVAGLGALVLVVEVVPRGLDAAALASAWRAEAGRLGGDDLAAEQARLDAERRALRARAGRTTGELPESGELSVVLGALGAWADSAGAALVEVEPGVPIAEAGYEVLPVRLVVRGPTGAVGRFVSAVERARSPLRVRSLSLAGSGLEPGPVTATVEVDALQRRAPRDRP